MSNPPVENIPLVQPMKWSLVDKIHIVFFREPLLQRIVTLAQLSCFFFLLAQGQIFATILAVAILMLLFYHWSCNLYRYNQNVYLGVLSWYAHKTKVPPHKVVGVLANSIRESKS